MSEFLLNIARRGIGQPVQLPPLPSSPVPPLLPEKEGRESPDNASDPAPFALGRRPAEEGLASSSQPEGAAAEPSQPLAPLAPPQPPQLDLPAGSEDDQPVASVPADAEPAPRYPAAPDPPREPFSPRPSADDPDRRLDPAADPMPEPPKPQRVDAALHRPQAKAEPTAPAEPAPDPGAEGIAPQAVPDPQPAPIEIHHAPAPAPQGDPAAASLPIATPSEPMAPQPRQSDPERPGDSSDAAVAVAEISPAGNAAIPRGSAQDPPLPAEAASGGEKAAQTRVQVRIDKLEVRVKPPQRPAPPRSGAAPAQAHSGFKRYSLARAYLDRRWY